jgi:hypothetical protein
MYAYVPHMREAIHYIYPYIGIMELTDDGSDDNVQAGKG